jgi:hypothetical protein
MTYIDVLSNNDPRYYNFNFWNLLFCGAFCEAFLIICFFLIRNELFALVQAVADYPSRLVLT